MGETWLSSPGTEGTVVVRPDGDRLVVTSPTTDRRVVCIPQGAEVDAGGGVALAVSGTVIRYMRARGDGPDFLVLDVDEVEVDEVEETPAATKVADRGPTPAATAMPRRRIGDLRGDGMLVRVDAVFAEIIRYDPDPTGTGPRLIGRVYDRAHRSVTHLVVPKGITHPFLEEGSTIHLEGVRDSWNRRQGAPELVLTERSDITVIEEPMTGKQHRGSLEAIAKEVAERTDPNREVGRPQSVVSDAKRRARSQQRDPAIDPRLR
jgi:hypothetical protein